MQNLNITQFQAVISEFAKANKVSRAKIEAYTAAVIASLPKGKASAGKQGRPVLEKTSALHNEILNVLLSHNNKACDSVTLRGIVSVNISNLNKITFNNAISALMKQGKIYHAGKAKTGSRGRQPFILTTNKPE